MANEFASSPSPPGNVAILFAELERRTLRPAGETVFWTYLVAGIIALGGFGVILEALRALLADGDREWGSLYTALLTYSPAIAGPALLQIVFETPTNRRLTAFVVISGLCTVAVMVGLFMFGTRLGALAWVAALLACAGSAWLWWIANADNVGLHDDPEAPLGGSETAPLSGDYGQFKV
ncbi:hypothetical protein [Brevundimonas bullata]